MLEIGFPELILIAIVGLLVIGPERLPETLRTLGLWLGRMRRSFTQVKAEIEKEIGMDEVRRQLHNEAIMEEMKRIEAEVKHTADSARSSLNAGIEQATPPRAMPPTPSIDPNVHEEVSDLISAQDGGPGRTPPAADDRDHTDAGAEDDRYHTDAGAEPDPDHTDGPASGDRESRRVTSG